MFVAEAPGKSENRQGIPFVGVSGKFLRQHVALAGLTNDEVFYTNAVRCWPGEGNRDPTNEELMNCAPWLEEEIERVNPEFIVALGKVAQKSLAAIDVGGRPVLALYHPSYILRNRSKSDAWVSELTAIANLAHGVADDDDMLRQPSAWYPNVMPDLTSDWLALDTERDALGESCDCSLVSSQLS